MPQFSDDLWLGSATGPQSQGWNGPGQVFAGVGPLGRTYIYDVVPAAISATAVVNAQAAAAAGSVTLTASPMSLSAARALTVKSSGADTTQVVTITGTDFWGQAQTEALTLNGTTAVNGKKAFKSVTGVSVSAALAGNLSVGTLDVFGLPYAVTDAGYLFRTGWNGAVADNAGTLVVADGAAATSTTGDVRGTFAPTGSASDGVRRLVIGIALTGIQAGPSATQTGAIGVTPA